MERHYAFFPAAYALERIAGALQYVRYRRRGKIRQCKLARRGRRHRHHRSAFHRISDRHGQRRKRPDGALPRRKKRERSARNGTLFRDRMLYYGLDSLRRIVLRRKTPFKSCGHKTRLYRRRIFILKNLRVRASRSCPLQLR